MGRSHRESGTRGRKGAVIGAAALTVLAVAAPTPRADACGHSMGRRIDPLVQAVSDAEGLSSKGEQKAAMARLRAAAPDIAHRKLGGSADAKLGDRALRVAARAIVRSNGDVRLPGIPGVATATGDDDMKWATLVLRGIAARSTDPQSLADLGEALERSPSSHREARRLLEPLERGDTMTSAFGYAALGRIKAKAPERTPSWLGAPLVALDAGTRLVDVARCKAMIKSPSMCGDEAGDSDPGRG